MRLTKRLAIAATVALFGALSSAALAADKLVIGTEGAYPPFNNLQADGSLTGFDIDIAKALCDEMKVECTFVTQDWDGIIPALQAKKFDFMIASMFITPERAEKVAFTKAYYKTPMTHIAPKGAGITEFTNEALKGKVIGAQAGTTQAEYATATYPDAEVKLYPTQDEVNLEVIPGVPPGIPPDFPSHSHGEGFLRFFEERCQTQGIFIFDEPESALSPARQIEFLNLLVQAFRISAQG